MIAKLLKFVERKAIEDKSASLAEDEFQTALAALLIHASQADGQTDAVEEDKLSRLLKDHFDLEKADLETLLARARDREQAAVDLYGFVRVLNDRLDDDGRKEVVEMLWEVVLADEELDDFEAHMMSRVCELLGIGTRDRVLLRQKVAARA